MNADRAFLDLVENGLEAVHVEGILKNVSIRLDQYREARELLHGLK